ncbi:MULTISPECIES: stage III sporulation protein AB [Anaerostipes]|uniref:stage III sporulation protein AB n=1 Tax=Anaerostipes TaxID=207244 RepID=UPI0009516468|nr:MULTISPECIES: stage III sporulation protein AB [Anaerostipes]MCI5623272.1 stage III sporulation protein AB [Anaerostipes sp.]MDY2726551.1 stage III sporulation protein AB [Anaerostipes faecalis]OLR58615.1 stage III sporulation protein AD [Anaerostipes sp. 494a]
MIKIIGACMIIASGISFGFIKAAKEQKKLEQGIALKRMLYLLQGEIRYGFTPLPEAIRAISKKTVQEFAPFLQNAADRMDTHSEDSFASIWKNSMEENLSPIILEKSFMEPILTMGETIGYLDKEMQLKTISFAIEQVEDIILQIKEQVIRNCKMYRSFGISFSLLIVIILL